MEGNSAQFEVYRQAKEHTLDLLGKSHDWLSRVGQTCVVSDAADILAQNIRRVNEDTFNLVVVGEFSSGKSYFINVLLDKIKRKETKRGKFKVVGMLPTRLSPTTSTITVLRYGTPERAVVTYKDGRVVQIALEDVEEYLAEAAHSDRYEADSRWLNSLFGKKEKGTTVHQVEVFCDAPWLQNGVCVVDTPGTGSIIREHAAITTSYIPKADAVLFLFSAQPPINNQARLFLSQCAFHVDRFFFVQTMKDSEYTTDGNGSWDPVVENGRSTIDVATEQNAAILSAALTKPPAIFRISSRWAANEKLNLVGPGLEMSGFVDLVSYLEEFLVQNRGLVMLRRLLTQCQEMVASFDAELAALEAQVGKSVAEIEAKLKEQEPVVQSILDQAEDLLELVTNELDSAVRDVRGSDSEAFAFLRDAVIPRLRSLGLERMSRTELKEVGTNIAYFVQQGMNAWISQKSYSSVRPVFRELRRKIRREGAVLEESVRELADISGAISGAISKLGSLDISQVTLPDTTIIETKMQSSVSEAVAQESSSGGFWNTVVNVAKSVWDWFTGSSSSQGQAKQQQQKDRVEEVVKELNAALRQLSTGLVASYAEFLEQQGNGIKSQITMATNAVIRQYNGSLKNLRDKLMETQHETECQIKGIRNLRQEGSDILIQCEEALAGFTTEQVVAARQ